MVDNSQRRPMGIARRLGLLIVCALAGIVAITAIVLGSERSLIMEERKTSLRQNVESAHSLIAHFHAQAKAGKMPEEHAQQMARDSLRAMRYSGNEYFWINDMRPVMVMHPICPELDGKDLSDNKDPTGMRLFVEFVNVVKAREAGFVLYLWPKPGSTAPVLKASYVKGFAPWGWLVGSGVYVDAVDSAVNERIVKFGLSALVLAALLLGVSMLIFARPQARTAGQRVQAGVESTSLPRFSPWAGAAALPAGTPVRAPGALPPVRCTGPRRPPGWPGHAPGSTPPGRVHRHPRTRGPWPRATAPGTSRPPPPAAPGGLRRCVARARAGHAVTGGADRTRRAPVRGLWGAVFLGGVGRALSMAWLGLPPAPFIGFTVLELVGTPAFIVWQRRVARAAPAHA